MANVDLQPKGGQGVSDSELPLSIEVELDPVADLKALSGIPFIDQITDALDALQMTTSDMAVTVVVVNPPLVSINSLHLSDAVEDDPSKN